MNLSQKGINLLKSIETLSLTPYDDAKPKAGVITDWCEGATIGYGHLISKSEWPKYSKAITEDQADSLFMSDAQPMVDAVLKYVKNPLKVNELDALVILCFNIGISAFSKSSVVKMLNGEQGNYATLEEAWKAFNKDRGQINKGLVNRRQAEWNIWTKGVYEHW